MKKRKLKGIVVEEELQERDREKGKNFKKETTRFNAKTETGGSQMMSPKERKEGEGEREREENRIYMKREITINTV